MRAAVSLQVRAGHLYGKLPSKVRCQPIALRTQVAVIHPSSVQDSDRRNKPGQGEELQYSTYQAPL